MLNSIIKQHATDFAIIDCLHIEKMASIIKTSFSWSRVPNSLCLAMNKKYFHQAADNNNICAIIVTPNAFDSQRSLQGKAVIIAEKADELFYFLHNAELHVQGEIHQDNSRHIAVTACIDKSVYLGSNVFIGENVLIHHGCFIAENVVIGNNTVLQPNVTLGTEGFFSKYVLGEKVHIRHYGGVRLGENCIVHAGTNIARSVNYKEYTELGDNVHIGIHSNIGHDCSVGSGTDISAKVLLAGRVTVGEKCWIGAGAIVSNALSIGDRASVKIGAVVIEDVPSGAEVSGNFAMSHTSNLRSHLKARQK